MFLPNSGIVFQKWCSEVKEQALVIKGVKCEEVFTEVQKKAAGNKS